MTSPQSPEVIPLASIAGGAINMQRTFPVLFSLAMAMKLDHTGTKKDLLPRILKELKDDTSTVLAQSAEYMKFSVYRAPKTAQTATKNLKNSAERAAEEAEEEAEPVLPATGCEPFAMTACPTVSQWNCTKLTSAGLFVRLAGMQVRDAIASLIWIVLPVGPKMFNFQLLYGRGSQDFSLLDLKLKLHSNKLFPQGSYPVNEFSTR
ncbi:hypothetical protein B0H13DRAFT_1897744 [Mycena leptocephala]|nr:hypothetical protein B0H13DRAFT_1897744 [Mycena leptocephala]